MPQNRQEDAYSQILERIESLEQIARTREESLIQFKEKTSDDMLELKELMRRDVRAADFFKKVTVSIGNTADYDHDTLILMDDKERGFLRNLLIKEGRAEIDIQREIERKKWWQTKIGQMGIVLGSITVLLNGYAAVASVFHFR